MVLIWWAEIAYILINRGQRFVYIFLFKPGRRHTKITYTIHICVENVQFLIVWNNLCFGCRNSCNHNCLLSVTFYYLNRFSTYTYSASLNEYCAKYSGQMRSTLYTPKVQEANTAISIEYRLDRYIIDVIRLGYSPI